MYIVHVASQMFNPVVTLSLSIRKVPKDRLGLIPYGHKLEYTIFKLWFVPRNSLRFIDNALSLIMSTSAILSLS